MTTTFASLIPQTDTHSQFVSELASGGPAPPPAASEQGTKGVPARERAIHSSLGGHPFEFGYGASCCAEFAGALAWGSQTGWDPPPSFSWRWWTPKYRTRQTSTSWPRSFGSCWAESDALSLTTFLVSGLKRLQLRFSSESRDCSSRR